MSTRKTRRSEFGAVVDSALEERAMSQLDLAEATGRSPAYTNQTLTGVKPVSPEWVNLVAETLQLSAEKKAQLHRAAAKDRGYEIDLGTYIVKD